MSIYFTTDKSQTTSRKELKMSKYIRILLVFSILLTTIPCAVFLKNDKKEPAGSIEKTNFSLPSEIEIMNKTDSSLSEIPLDDYLIGCVLAQIPCNFEPEALKCQAIIARTYVYYHLYHKKSLSENPQSYFTYEEAREFYGENYQSALDKATLAVFETDGLVLTYENAPIVTAFHPVSYGFTESSEDIWGEEFPYLVSVKSPYDENSSQGIQEIKITKTEFFSRLCAYLDLKEDENMSFEINKKTNHNTVLSLEISNDSTKKEIAGTEFAEIFNTNSCNFTISITDNSATITCYGGGHLVGLSQCGANLMAVSQNTYEEILTHYFQGVSLIKLK